MNTDLLTLKPGSEPAPEVIRAILLRDWRYLYPLRHQLGDRIREVLGDLSPELIEARAAFGLEVSREAPGWLYRDFYLDCEPSARTVDRALGKLRRGDAGETIDGLRGDILQEVDYLHVWYDVSSLAGRILGQPRVAQGAQLYEPALRFDPPIVAGGPPRHVENQREVSDKLIDALSGPLGMEAHRHHALQSLEELLSDRLGGTEAASTLTLLQHHTDDLKDSLGGDISPFDLGRVEPFEQTRQRLAGLRIVLSSGDLFLDALKSGLRSPSRARRFLAYRLLLWEGEVSRTAHPDDQADWTR